MAKKSKLSPAKPRKPRAKPKPTKAKKKPSKAAAKAALLKAERAADAIRDAFGSTSERLASGKRGPAWFKDIAVTYEVRRYVNNAVDGLMRLADLPDDVPIAEVLLELEEAEIFVKPRRFRVWLQIGFSGDFEKPDVKRARDKAKAAGNDPPPPPPPHAGHYNRYKGQSVTQLHSQRLDRFAEHLLAARVVGEKLENKSKIPDAILVRYFWAANMNERPKPKGK